MNRLLDLRHLNNRYFIMRHGESEANRLGLIVSDPALGVGAYGLSERGRDQARAGIDAARAGAAVLDRRTIIICSDFLRARQTADIVAAALDAPPPRLEAALRERFFGDFDGGSAAQYETVWRADRLDATRRERGVEAAAAVTERATRLVQSLERRWRHSVLLLVAHGDVLQLLQTAFERCPAEQHRALRPLQTAEVRELRLAAPAV